MKNVSRIENIELKFLETGEIFLQCTHSNFELNIPIFSKNV